MLLYHGTDNLAAKNITTCGIDFDKCDRFTDNARGFYLSKDKEFAKERARTMTFAPYKPVVIEMYFNEEKARKNLSIKTFDRITDDWKFFVAFNRTGFEKFKLMNSFFPNKLHNLDYKYDVVIDIPADARISLITDKIDRILDDVNNLRKPLKAYRRDVLELIYSINEGNVDLDAKQYSFHTARSLKYLELSRIIKVI